MMIEISQPLIWLRNKNHRPWPLPPAEIAKQLQGEVLGDGTVVLKGFAPADCARSPGDPDFRRERNYFARAEQSACLSHHRQRCCSRPRKKSSSAWPMRGWPLRACCRFFFPEPTFAPGIHPSAVVAPDGPRFDRQRHIGPQCVIGENVIIGARSVLQRI